MQFLAEWLTSFTSGKVERMVDGEVSSAQRVDDQLMLLKAPCLRKPLDWRIPGTGTKPVPASHRKGGRETEEAVKEMRSCREGWRSDFSVR